MNTLFYFYSKKHGLTKLLLVTIAQVFLVSLSLSQPARFLPTPNQSRPSLPDFPETEENDVFQLPPAPKPVHEVGEGGPRVLLKAVLFEGNTVISTEELLGIAEPYINHEVNKAELEDLRIKLSQYYIDKGFISSGAILPQQSFPDGALRVQIVEGELVEIRVSGTGRLDNRYVTERLALGVGPPLNSHVFEDRFQLMLMDPLIDRMDGRLRTGSGLGESIFDVDITRTKPYRLSVTLDNHRSSSTGSEQLQLDGMLRNLSGFGDMLNVSASTKEGADGFDLGYQIPLNRFDTLVGLRYTSSDSEVVESSMKELAIKSKFTSADIFVQHPLLLKQDRHITIGAKLSYRKNVNKMLGIPWPFNASELEDPGISRVAALRASFEASLRQTHQVTSFLATLSHGVGAFDSTQNDGGVPDSDFLSLLLQFQSSRLIAENGTQLRLRIDAQFAEDPLLPMERFSIGGGNSVRGYRENEQVRDKGYIVSIGLLYPLNSLIDHSFGNFSTLLFTDYGDTKSNQDETAVDADALFSIGAGLLWQHSDVIEADLFIAHAIEDVEQDSKHNLQDDGVHLRIAIKLL